MVEKFGVCTTAVFFIGPPLRLLHLPTPLFIGALVAGTAVLAYGMAYVWHKLSPGPVRFFPEMPPWFK